MLKKIRVGLGILPGLLKVKLGRPIPLFCQWEITFRCNMNCEFCPIPQHMRDWPELETGKALDLVDQLSGLGTKIMNFGGGEPFLRKDFFEIASRAKERGMIVFVNTNGSLVEKRASEISRENFDFVRVSIDGTREFHDKVRRYSGAFDSAIRAVEIFNKKKISCMINTVVTDFTEAGMMSGLLGKARELGVKVSLTPAIHSLPCIENPQRKDLGKDLKKTLISMQKFLRVLREAQKQYPEVIDDPGAYWKIIEKGGLEKYGCRVMDTAIGIKPDGRLGFPCADFPAKAVAGRTLAEAYYGKEAEKQRRLQGKYWFCENCFSRCGAFPTMLLDAKALLSLAISWSDF